MSGGTGSEGARSHLGATHSPWPWTPRPLTADERRARSQRRRPSREHVSLQKALVADSQWAGRVQAYSQRPL